MLDKLWTWTKLGHTLDMVRMPKGNIHDGQKLDKYWTSICPGFDQCKINWTKEKKMDKCLTNLGQNIDI